MLRKGTPGTGSQARGDSFSYTPVLAGLKNGFSAWVAGETYWCNEAHEHKPPHHIGTKPCLHWMTSGELDCPRCRKQPETKCVGWLPLYREEDTHPIIVIVHEVVFDLVRSLRYGERVMVGRVTPTSSVYVRKSDTQILFRTDTESRKRAVDITHDLLSMWQLPDLNAWLKCQGRANAGQEVANASEETIERAKEEFSPLLRAAAIRHGAVSSSDNSGVGDAQERIFNRVTSAERNGHHKPTGKK